MMKRLTKLSAYRWPLIEDINFSLELGLNVGLLGKIATGASCTKHSLQFAHDLPCLS